MEVKPAQHTLLAGQQQDLYLLITFKARELSPIRRLERPSLNLGLVLDRSGSMDDRGKMEYAITTACNLIDMLSPRDYLGVVEYDDQITVLWPSAPLQAPGMLKQLIRGLTPRHSTNLMGGLDAGVEQVRGAFSPLTVNRVLLLSDGLANTGITDPWAIRAKVQEFRRQGITVSTLGLGLHYDEDLMQLIAEHGAGRYYYIENPTQMSRIFQQEMDFIFETVTRDVRLVYHSHRDGNQNVEVIGYPAETRDDRSFDITLENFYAGETRNLLIRLTLTPGAGSSIDLGRLQLDYIDLENGDPVRVGIPIEVAVSSDQQLVNASRDDSTTVAATLMDLDWQQVQYVRLFEEGEKEQALGQMGVLRDKVSTMAMAYDDARIGIKQEALEIEVEQMEQVTPGTEAYQDYLKSSKQRSYFAVKGEGALHARGARDTGLEVEFIQQALADSGYYSGPVDGVYSDEVTEAVKEFQRRKGLNVDGIAGPRTLQSLGIY